jgi:hypothetical protein
MSESTNNANEQEEIVDSPDNENSKDENLETDNEQSEDNVNATEESTVDEVETPTDAGDDSEETDSQTDSDKTEESQDLAKQHEDGDLPKWQDKRFLRSLKKHERKMRQIEEGAKQRSQLQTTQQQAPQYDPNTQLQNPYTGEIVDISSVQGQTLLQLAQVAESQARFEEQQKNNKEREELKQKLEKGLDKFEDFEEVVVGAGLTDTMVSAANLSEKPDELLYNLAKYKPEEVERISKLSPEKQFREMVLMETQMKQSTKKKIVKKVPEPPSKIKGSGASIKDDSDLSFNDLLKRRQDKERKAAGLPPV